MFIETNLVRAPEGYESHYFEYFEKTAEAAHEALLNSLRSVVGKRIFMVAMTPKILQFDHSRFVARAKIYVKVDENDG